MTEATDYKCPQCHQLDRVQKVSAAWEETSRSSLQPPPKPEPAERLTYNRILWSSGLLGLVPLTVTLFVNQTLAYPVWVGSSAAIFCWIGGNWLLRWKPRQEARDAEKVSEWASVRRRWESLFYCSRCDGVFVPDMSPLVPARLALDFVAFKRDRP